MFNRAACRISRAVATALMWLVMSSDAFSQEVKAVVPDFDQRIEAALALPVTVDFSETPLAEAIRTLAAMVRIPIRIDGEDKVASETPITLNARDVSLETMLDMMLRMLPEPLELGWTIRDGAVLITARSSAENDLQLKYYPVAKLVQTVWGNEQGDDELQELVSANVAPESWDESGGPATLTVLPRGVWIIWQADWAHEDIELRLAELREAIKAGEDEASKLPNAGHVVVAPKRTLRRTVYRISGLSSDDVVETIRGSISPSTWDAKGGEGSIQIVHPEPPHPSANDARDDAETKQPTAPHVLVVVCQTTSVHREIVKLLRELGVPEPIVIGGWRGAY